MRYDGNQKQILRNYCLAKVNCSISQFDNIIIHNFTETVKPLLKDVEKNLQLTKGEITDLEKEKQNILYRSLIFQILGISLSQIAIIMQIIKDNN
ncbi:MAG: hypothetical protein E4G94_05705 [ANME-2 cluster archaeon]|nr:MAG: hypothetical protein E4G94_05705 [ANME-2 cluster archaeon]